MANDPKWNQQLLGTRDLHAILEGMSTARLPRQIYSVLSGDRGLPSPDFMIVHNIFPSSRRRKQPLELHGFPPWQITLTEFQCVPVIPDYQQMLIRVGAVIVASTLRLLGPGRVPHYVTLNH